MKPLNCVRSIEKPMALFAITGASLVTVLGASSPAGAAGLKPDESFGTEGIVFTENTNMSFTFRETHGKFQSALKLFQVGDDDSLTWIKDLFVEVQRSDNGEANGWLGTCGTTVLPGADGNCTESVTFQSNAEYTFGLVSDNGTVYSTNRLNGGSQQTLFGSFGSTAPDGTMFLNPFDFAEADPFGVEVAMGFDDRGNGNDRDFQDMTWTATAERQTSQEIPEPSLILGSIVALLGFAPLRRRR
ncbi:MAG: DUF4114 domain-containing protein [Cyanobacteria bacterium SID2]|nr:DUF4114 domain-containing protein [Cyanobacteria bacterium SID2]MBP0005727.1 DUF4114 domain-containing protein [Cyanobacteria bacterium SBC]